MKQCSKCKREFPATKEYFYRKCGSKDGLAPHCKECDKKYRQSEQGKKIGKKAHKKYVQTEHGREVQRKLDKKCYQKNKKAKINRNLKYVYDITFKDKCKLYERQKSCCAICNKKQTLEEIHIDHDHNTGKIRGLLCRQCNLGLGHFKDNLENIKKAMIYLENNEYKKGNMGFLTPDGHRRQHILEDEKNRIAVS